MKKLDLYILKSFLGPFIMIFLIVMFILMMQFLWLYIDELVGKGLTLGTIIEFLGWGSATVIPLALPLATLISSLMTMGNLGENNELLAMKAAGISLPRILIPLIIVAIMICVGAFFASNNLIPIAYNKIYLLRDDIKKTMEEIKIPTGIFYDGIPGYNIRVVENGKNGKIYEVMVYDHSKNKGNISLTVADSGTIKLTSDKSGLIFTLFDGTSYEEDNTRNYRDTSLNLSRVNFSAQQIIIPLGSNYSFQKSENDDRYRREVMTRKLSQLQVDKDSLSIAYDATLESQFKKIVFMSQMKNSYQLDTAEQYINMPPLNIDSLYSNSEPNILRWDSKQSEIKAINKAISSIKEQIEFSDYYERELDQPGHTRRRTIVEIYRKFTLSLACLIFFFIGAPLGAIIRKGGLGTPIIISAFFFVAYWVIDISGKKLANGGSIAPFIGTFISTIVLIPIGAFLTWKSTKDSALFNIDPYITFFKNIAKKGYLKSKWAQWREERRLNKQERTA